VHTEKIGRQPIYKLRRAIFSRAMRTQAKSNAVFVSPKKSAATDV